MHIVELIEKAPREARDRAIAILRKRTGLRAYRAIRDLAQKGDDAVCDAAAGWQRRGDGSARDDFWAGVISGNLRGTTGRDISILDVGCGDGGVSAALAKMLEAKLVLGVEVPHYMEKEHSAEAAQIEISILPRGILDMTNHAQRYNLIVFNMVLHHVPDPAAALRIASDLLLPDGKIYIREHDVRNSWDHELCNLEHKLYDRKNWKATYGSLVRWAKIAAEAGGLVRIGGGLHEFGGRPTITRSGWLLLAGQK